MGPGSFCVGISFPAHTIAKIKGEEKMLLGYYQSPAVCALEHEEQRDLLLHPEKAEYYNNLVLKRWGRRRKKKEKEKGKE